MKRILAVAFLIIGLSASAQYYPSSVDNPLNNAEELMPWNWPDNLVFAGQVYAFIPGQGYGMVCMWEDSLTGYKYWENPLDNYFDFSYDDRVLEQEETEWNEFIAEGDALIAQRIAEDNAAAMQRAGEIVASGRLVQINYSDGTTEIRLPDGSTKTFDNPNGLKVVVPVYADGYKFEGIGLSQSAVNILNDPSRKIISYVQAEAQALMDATFTRIADLALAANNALFDSWLRTNAWGRPGESTELEGYIGAGAFGHSFDGWLDWDYETGAWDVSELNTMFLAEAPYQIPVLQTIYKLILFDAAYNAEYYNFWSNYTPEIGPDGWRVIRDPITGNAMSSKGLITEVAIEASTLVLTYKLTPTPYSFGSYADDIVLARISVPAAESTAALRVATPYGPAIQADTAAALAARSQVEGGATLYRIGTMGKSAAGEAQFWSLESPLSPGYAARYGIPAENIAAADFLETATLRPGSPFVTRVAPGVGANGGGAIEAVVQPGGVTLRTFSTGTPGSP